MSDSLEPMGEALIEPRLLRIRGMRVVLDADLARIYGVKTSRLNEQVTRNRDRFPPDFMFRLSKNEKAEVIANCDTLWKIKYSSALPRVYTEHGALMAASVLNTQQAVKMSIFVVRAFVRFRSMLSGHEEFAQRLSELEAKFTSHDESIQNIVKALREMLNRPDDQHARPIGFSAKEATGAYATGEPL